MTTPLKVTLTFTLEEFAMLGRMADEGMWELARKPRSPQEVELQNRVCELLRMPGYERDEGVRP